MSQGTEYTHTYPENDLIEHNTDFKNEFDSCPYNPKIDGLHVKHNSMDRREVYEECNMPTKIEEMTITCWSCKTVFSANDNDDICPNCGACCEDESDTTEKS